ncbi:nucleic-acid-binding protein from transposon X-element [Trichonephila clavipes]|nr:nucleic-acid-binding protein from transposon X-element [Trichonephila clavipes]
MMTGRLSFLEHCIKSEKEFPDLTDDGALVGYQKDYDELSSLKEHKLGFLQLRRKVSRKIYLKIFTTSTDEHRIVTDYLKEKCEEFYVINPPDSRPQKIVIKGLPVSTEIGEIQADLTSQGFCVRKVAQLTRSKTKSPFPIFMVELERNPDSPDIFQLKKCFYLAVQVDTFNRRPGVSQCYYCNLFNHSSKNCYMRTRCLKCGESHRTSDCPIKEKITNPICINCNKTGHMANWSQCKEFPKRKPKKGETIHNRNTIKEPEIKKPSKTVTPNLSFAAALSGAPNKNSIPETSAASEETPTINEKNDENYFGFNDATNELRRFFLDYPFLLEMERQVRNAKDEERIDIFYQNLVNNYNPTRPPNGRRAAQPMERVPLPSQLAFLPCTSHPKDSSKARSPIGRETLNHWSNESL